MKKELLIGTMCAVFACFDAAVAADAALPAYKASAAPAFSWTGVYIGGHFGGGFQETTFDDPFVVVVTPGPRTRILDFNNFIGGEQAGWNYQIGNLVVGNEVEFSWSNLNGSRTTSLSVIPGGFVNPNIDTRTIKTKTDWFGTATARLGFAMDRMLFYTKGGAAWARFSNQLDDATVLSGAPQPPTSFTAKDTRVGWTIGAGFEWAFWHNLSAKIEYDYLAFSNKSVILNVTGGGTNPPVFDSAEHSIQVVKAGLNWHLVAGDTPWGPR